MSNLSRVTARLAVAASFAALLTVACNTDSNGPASRGMSADRSFNSPQSASSGFAVLANQAVTCTDASISGSVGTLQAPPTGSFTQTICPVDGSIDIGDAAAIGAYNDFLGQYAALATAPCDVVLTGTLDGVTLAPGTYCFDAAAALTGTLTLKGPSNGVWLFKIGTSGTGALTGTNFSVVMVGGQPCNVTWWVAQAATLTDSHFIGSILAGAAITLTRGTFDGNAYAGASGVGDVTITGTTVVGCAGRNGSGKDHERGKCNQGVGNGPEGCDPGNSNNHNLTNDENGGTPGNPGRQGDKN